MDIISELAQFYDNQADKFHNTRKKHWPEFDLILKQIQDYEADEIKILELGCGSGRLLKYLNENTTKKIKYNGVDISNNLIQIARLENPSGQFIVADMISYMEMQSHESFDLIIAFASFQHIGSKKERLIILKNIYKSLKYGGLCIMSNWSYSQRFFNKYKIETLKALLRMIYTGGFYKYNDYFIPWKSGDIIFRRYYHIFTIKELKVLFNLSGFITKISSYCNVDGSLSGDYRNSRNTFFVGEKNVIEN
ncbi:MAG: class I SAM-dependent methyltransferase [Candidatus Absconditabacteria bacterium]